MKQFLILSLFSISFILSSSVSAQEFGLASYYADQFHGRETAYGLIYDKNKLTCAHKRHPLGTRLKVTRLDNKKTVVVTVTDKGPYVAGKIIDLSRAAAARIDLLEVGVAEVKVEVVGKIDVSSGDSPSNTAQPEEAEPAPRQYDDTPLTTNKPEASAKEEKPSPKPKQNNTTSTSSSPSKPAKSKSTNTAKTPTKKKEMTPRSPDRAALVGKDYQKYGLYKIQLMRPEIKGYGVQVVSLTNYENVLKSVADYQAKGFSSIYINIEPGAVQPVYKIILGMFDNEASANRYKSDLKRKYKVNGFVVSFTEE